MSKILKLNGFISVNETQEYLSKAIGEHVSLAELYQLVLSGNLVISARFHRHERALLGKYIPFSSKQYLGLLKENQIPEEWDWIDIDHIYYDEKINQYYALNPSVTNITGCWDFSMLGSEANVIDHYYRMQALNSIITGLSGVNLDIEKADILLKNGDQVARLQPENQSERHVKFDYFLNMLVFKKQELNRFIQSLNENPPTAMLQEKSLTHRERNSYLNLISTLCHEAKFNIKQRGISQSLALATETNGHPLSDDTIRKIISQVIDFEEQTRAEKS